MCAVLKASSDFQRISRLGKKCVFPAFIMQALKREGENAPCRIGLTVSRRLGSAVARNRAKRRLREMVRLSGVSERLAGWDIVLIGRDLPKEREFSLMKKDFLQGLAKLGVLS